MVFSSPLFLFAFLPALLLVYYAVNDRLKNLVLVLFSLFFYAWGEPKNVFLMLLSILLNYLMGLGIERFPKSRKWILTGAVCYNLGALFVFKYLNFAVNVWNSMGIRHLTVAQIALPIGISFYTFQILSYVVDVYRGNCKAQHNLLHLTLYVSLFPQLIAGPIVRYVDVESQINRRQISLEKMAAGLIRFAKGFAKKVLIADQLSFLVDTVFEGQYPSIGLHWLGIIAYALQIYYDFSGYSDMAIGLGKLFGFDFLENFQFPYISKSVREFWRRWHISLSTWFRDYLYIPLGGNRKGTMRTYINLLIVFTATGLWHGASFNFLVWGLYYAVFLILERVGFSRCLERIPSFFQHLYAILVVLIGWVFFRADGLMAAFRYIGRMFVPSGNDWANMMFVMDRQYWFCLIIGIVFAVPFWKKLKASLQKTAAWDVGKNVFIILCFLTAVCYMVGSGFSPFLYFRF